MSLSVTNSVTATGYLSTCILRLQGFSNLSFPWGGHSLRQERQVTYAELLSDRREKLIQFIGWGVRALFSGMCNFYYKRIGCFPEKLPTSEWKLDLPHVGCVGRHGVNPRPSQWRCSFPATVFCSQITNASINMGVVKCSVKVNCFSV